MDIIVISFLVLCLIIVLFAILSVITRSLLFRQDKRNSYKRYCRLCGQQQDEYGYSIYHRVGWWKDMYEINNPECLCHIFVKNTG